MPKSRQYSRRYTVSVPDLRCDLRMQLTNYFPLLLNPFNKTFKLLTRPETSLNGLEKLNKKKISLLNRLNETKTITKTRIFMCTDSPISYLL